MMDVPGPSPVTVIIVALLAFKWTLRRTLNNLSPPSVSICKVNSQYSAAQVDKVIIIKMFEFSLFL